MRLTLIVLLGAAALPAALFGPSWVDHRHNPRFDLSAHVLNFGPTPVNARAEELLTIRNEGHTTITDSGGGGTLFDFPSVCPRRLGVHKRRLDCGFSTWPAAACETLKPGASCAVAIHFVARTARPYHARYCFDYVTTGQDRRRTERCLTVTGRGTRGGKGRPAR